MKYIDKELIKQGDVVDIQDYSGGQIITCKVDCVSNEGSGVSILASNSEFEFIPVTSHRGIIKIHNKNSK